jgi:acyl phosphate:glycerol-3-phosphate acyltransferase
MPLYLAIIIALLAAYFIGAIPASYLVARYRKGVDIRDVGSRNMGAMNTFYSVGFWWGMLVLTVDISKGALAVAIAHWLGLPLLVELAAGAMAVIGHAYPVFMRFRGGKGGATALGVLAYVLFPWGFIYLVFFFSLLALTRVPTVSYSLAFFSFPFIGWLAFDGAAYIVFPFVMMLLPGLKYIPRIREMRRRAGSWRAVFLRKTVKERY